MTEENLIAADTNDTGAASSEGEPSKTAEQLLYPQEGSNETAGEQAVAEKPEPAPGPDEGETVVPEKYDLALPEDAVIDQEFLTEFEGIAKEAKLNNDQAKKFAELGTKLSSKLAEAQAQKQAQQVEQWRSESVADPEIGGDKLNENLAVAKVALNQFASPELVQLLNQSGLGNHPEVIRAFFKVGKAISSDDSVVTGRAPNPQKSRAQTLYG